MKKILFVCLGNICRPPMAEAVMNKCVDERELTADYVIDSAGLIDYHEGELPDMRMRQHASMRGYYLTHRSRPIEMDDFARFDYIIGMDVQNQKSLCAMARRYSGHGKVLDMASFLTRHKSDSIPDPYYGGDSGFEYVIDLLEDACASLLDWLESQ